MLPKNLVFLISALLCGLVVGERGYSPTERRRVSIGDRPTPAPVNPSENGKGKGSNSDYEIGKGGKTYKSAKSEVGKGMNYYEIGKGAKSDKSAKNDVGKGKGMKSGAEYYGKGYDNTMSMDMELPDGKGEKDWKSSKKYDKKSKKDKKSAHGKYTSVPMPAASPTTPFEPTTSPPTSFNSISSRSSPYSITYSPSSDTPTPDDLNELTSLTQSYLEEYMTSFFGKTALTDLDNFLTIMVRDAFVEGEPVLVQYQSNGLFSEESIFIPVTREIDNLIQDAFGDESYLEQVRALPTSNPFRQTETIAFVIVDENTASARSKTSGESIRAGVAAAAAGVVVLAAGLAVLRGRRSSIDDEQSFSPRKSTSEDSTIAGETCNMSTDDSSGHFAHWRTMQTYNNETQVDDFEDEPLDSDDECEKMTTAASVRASFS